MERKKGFTLIELLVVIAIIALLMAIIVPALRSAKELASGVLCLSNQKNLCLGWTSYAEDYDQQLVGGSNYYSGTGGTPYRWVEYPLLNDTDNPENTPPANDPSQYSLQTRINGIRAGKLFPYIGDKDVYHCPGDRNITKVEPAATFRSYAISGLMNGEDFDNRATNSIYSPITKYRTVTCLGGKELYVVLKTTQIASPGNKYVFVEEDASTKNPPQHVNAGGFVLLKNGTYDWWDWPAYYHNDSSTVGFADGHGERHRWQDTDTIQLVKGEIPFDPHPDTNVDLEWMVKGYIPKP